MTIDWFTFFAQILNFLVLVWLLKRFLYQPVLDAMEAREKQIASRVEEAEEAKRVANEEADVHRDKIRELENTREKLVEEAADEVKAWREEHMQGAREEVEQARNEWYHGIEREQHAFIRELQKRAASHVHRLTEHILKDLANADLEQQAFEVFLERLGDITASERKQISDALGNSEKHVYVESAFELTEAQIERIKQVIHRGLQEELKVDFRVEPDLICGIELQAAGYKVAWSAEEILESMEEDLSRLLEASLDFQSAKSHEQEAST